MLLKQFKATTIKDLNKLLDDPGDEPVIEEGCHSSGRKGRKQERRPREERA